MPSDHVRRRELTTEIVVLDGEEATRMPLERRHSGIDAFRVEGSLDGSAVRASWDGHWVNASPPLARRVALALAVDEVFADAGLALPLAGDGRRPGAEDLLLAVLDCCDVIDVLEYELDGHRRVISWYP